MSGAASEIIVNTDIDNHNNNISDDRDIYYEDDLPKVDGSYTLYRFSGSINYININVYKFIYYRII